MRRILIGSALVLGASFSSGGEPPLPPSYELRHHVSPDYVFEPADTLIIDVRKLIPRPPYADEPLGGSAQTEIGGGHLVAADGTISLGAYGCVNVIALTPFQAKLYVERYLSRWFLNPEIVVRVDEHKTSVYFVIVDGDARVVGLRSNPKVTVLDALANLERPVTPTAGQKVWVARSTPKNTYQILPVNWQAITKGSDPETNWQLFPGDRVYVSAAMPPASSSRVVKISRKVIDVWKRWREPQKPEFGF